MGQEKSNTGRRKWKQLSERERYKIEVLRQQGLNAATIGSLMEPCRDRRTIERELARGMTMQRNSDWTERFVYLGDVGQRVHEAKAANKGRGLKIGHDHALARYLEQKIGEEKWSPDAAIGAIAAQGLRFEVTLCTKTVYNMIDRGDFLNLTNKSLPVKRTGKRRVYRNIRKVALNNLKGRSIEERPESVKNREEYGHWEMDLVVGCTDACLLVLTERKSRCERVYKLPNKTQGAVNTALDGLERRHRKRFNEIFKTITTDNGSEFLDSESLEKSCLRSGKKRTVWYYAHPYSAFERGSNENANKLIRRFIPKGADIGKYTKADIKRIELWMNNYPRRMFGYKTANDIAT